MDKKKESIIKCKQDRKFVSNRRLEYLYCNFMSYLDKDKNYKEVYLDSSSSKIEATYENLKVRGEVIIKFTKKAENIEIRILIKVYDTFWSQFFDIKNEEIILDSISSMIEKNI